MIVIGIDIAKDRLDLAVSPTGEQWTWATDADAVAALIDRLQQIGPERIVLEATGGLELALATALFDAGLPVAVVNPRQVRDCIAIGMWAAIDMVVGADIGLLGNRMTHDVSTW